ncbi:MAG: sigma-70 family RNA polymerase sigma factor [Bacteroidetes bacterium]|nr:MAG: sigma-70 family RNA polymerase sigma factor [Bacteroidota bacterium]
MFRLCMRYADSREVAEDLLQEGFARVFKDLGQFRGEGALGAWIRQVFVRTALTYLRKEQRRVTQISLSAELPGSLNGESEVLGAMGAAEIMKLLQSLPPGYRAVFNLFAIEGYSHKEIGELLHISERTSRSQYTRARALLARLLSTIDRLSS